jgi:hypothetical protein
MTQLVSIGCGQSPRGCGLGYGRCGHSAGIRSESNTSVDNPDSPVDKEFAAKLAEHQLIHNPQPLLPLLSN